MNLQESVNRSVNLLSVVIVGLAGFAFLPEIFLENEMPDKVDDIALLVIGLFGIWWYRKARNRFMRSALPVVLVVLALATKVGAVLVEFGDKESVGDDFGALILFTLAVGLVVYLYRTATRLSSTTSAA